MTRRQDAQRLAMLVGDRFWMEDAADGWPALGTVLSEDREIPVAVFVGPVGLSHRDRDEVERRFQNPGGGRPIVPPPGRVPLLVGLWDRDPQVNVPHPVVASVDVEHRIGGITRQSMFLPLQALQVASFTGWSDSVTTIGEQQVFFDPVLLPVVVEAAFDGVEIDGQQMAAVLAATGLVEARGDDAEEEAAGARARRATTQLVRDARFSRDVVDAYGSSCAMCGLSLGLIEAAHILPASAPGSEDVVDNGMALCRNHHGAFDRHLVWVDPNDFAIVWDPDVLARRDDPVVRFVDSTYEWIALPTDRRDRPHPDWFVARYQYFEGHYS